MKNKKLQFLACTFLISSSILAQTVSYDQNDLDRPGNNNTFIGSDSGNETLTGDYNTILGAGAGLKLTSGAYNTFIGPDAGSNITTGEYNIALGYFAGFNSSDVNEDGDSNIAIGNFSRHAAGGGNKNISIGDSSGRIMYTNASNNIAIGNSSGYRNSGNYSINIGDYSGFNNSGDYNVNIGYRAGFNNHEDNRLYIDNSSSSTPLIYGDFENDQLVFNGQVSTGYGNNSFPTTTTDGTDISDYTLFVKGGLLTEELRVLSDWADYVFEDSYKLKPLTEVEEFINVNGHLPNIPSAKEVEGAGIEVGEITKLQQEKIEALKRAVNQLLISQKQ